MSTCQIAGTSFFPVSLFNLVYWITKLGIQNLKAKTIKLYVAVMHLSQIDIDTT